MSQVLSQEEVDALLQGINGGDVETEKGIAPQHGETVAYDLTKPDKTVKFPKLGIIIDKFCKIFRITLSNLVRKMAEVNHVSTDMQRFDGFLKSLPVPANINIFDMEPLRGLNILTIDSPLIFYFVEVLFGGSGSKPAKFEGREFTSIENTVIRKIAHAILKDWGRAWEQIFPLRTHYQRSEINPKFAMIMPANELLIVFTFKIEIEETSQAISICIPYSNLEPIKEKLKGDFQVVQPGEDMLWKKVLIGEIQKTSVELKAELGRTKIKGRDLLNLAVGDVITLSRFGSDELDVYVQGILKFKGMAGTHHSNNAIQISTVIKRR